MEQKNSMKLQKWGGAASLYEALAYIIGFAGFIGGVNMSEIASPLDKVAAIVEYQGLLTALHLVVYVAWGAMLVVLTLALHERLNGQRVPLARIATAFGVIWSVLVIASGMIYNVGMETVVTLNASDPAMAGAVWMAIESVFNGLGGGVEVVGGIWVLLLSVTALRNGGLPRAFSYLGLLVGAAGIVSVIPAAAEIAAMVFGLTQIVWFAWLGIAMLRKSTAVEGAASLAGSPAK